MKFFSFLFFLLTLDESSAIAFVKSFSQEGENFDKSF